MTDLTSPISDAQIIERVQQLYNAYPFPPEPLSTVAPPGWNWRWSWPQAYAFCSGIHPGTDPVRILDAGCGSGVSTEYIAHQNPTAEIWAFDLSEKALEIAQSRCAMSQAPAVEFRQLNIYEIDSIPGSFQFINCVGVLHHLPDPVRGLQALATKLAPGGIMHIFVYGELGRWEIRLMQKALRLLIGGDEHHPLASVDQLQAGLQAGRSLFKILPDQNRIVQQERERWATENVSDECFADMYLHPQEIDYTIERLFDLIDLSGLDFLTFSNPSFWQLDRVLAKSPEWLEQAQALPPRQRYRLIELLDPVVAHYEFYVGKPPLPQIGWTEATIRSAIPHRSPCIGLWPSQSVFNYAYEPISLSEAAFIFLQAAEGQQRVDQILASMSKPISIEQLMDLIRLQLVLLEP